MMNFEKDRKQDEKRLTKSATDIDVDNFETESKQGQPLQSFMERFLGKLTRTTSKVSTSPDTVQQVNNKISEKDGDPALETSTKSTNPEKVEEDEPKIYNTLNNTKKLSTTTKGIFFKYKVFTKSNRLEKHYLRIKQKFQSPPKTPSPLRTVQNASEIPDPKISKDKYSIPSSRRYFGRESDSTIVESSGISGNSLFSTIDQVATDQTAIEQPNFLNMSQQSNLRMYERIAQFTALTFCTISSMRSKSNSNALTIPTSSTIPANSKKDSNILKDFEQPTCYYEYWMTFICKTLSFASNFKSFEANLQPYMVQLKEHTDQIKQLKEQIKKYKARKTGISKALSQLGNLYGFFEHSNSFFKALRHFEQIGKSRTTFMINGKRINMVLDLRRLTIMKGVISKLDEKGEEFIKMMTEMEKDLDMRSIAAMEHVYELSLSKQYTLYKIGIKASDFSPLLQKLILLGKPKSFLS